MAMKAWNLSFIFSVRTSYKWFQVFDFKDSDLGDLLSSRTIMEFQLHYRKHRWTFIHPFQLRGASISEWSPWRDELWGWDVVRGSAAMHSSWICCMWKIKVPRSSIKCLTPILQCLFPYTWSCWPGIFLSAALALCFSASNVSSLRAGSRLGQSSSVQNQKQLKFPPLPRLLLLPNQMNSLQGLPCQGRNQWAKSRSNRCWLPCSQTHHCPSLEWCTWIPANSIMICAIPVHCKQARNELKQC